jgi:3-deoxy-D-manno-octulosonate 8-phosphate phosphatase (KDO 8-P phosphatase)
MTAAPPQPPPALAAELARRARALEWLLLDVDGVMTDGRLYYSAAGEEIKVFHVRDGLGIELARRAGLKVGILSGRQSGALAKRAADLRLDALIQGRDDKGPAFDELLAAHATTAERVAYIGDDVLDLPILDRAGLSFAPADAVEAVRRQVDRVLAAPGGAGAVREAVELLLAARGEGREAEPQIRSEDGPAAPRPHGG